MMSYLVTAGALFLVCVTASRLHLNYVGIALFPVPVAVYLVRRRVNQALGLVACAAVAGWWSVGTFQAVVTYALLASVGVLLGLGLVRRWTYGRTLTASATLVCAVVVGGVLASWGEWQVYSRAFFDGTIAEWQLLLEGKGDEAPRLEQQVEALQWVRDHWADVCVGTLLWSFLAAGCMALSAAAVFLRRWAGIEGLRGSFRTMRVSEWLIWAAIGAAVFWFADYRWLESSLSVVSWNTAIGLAAIYWINGLSIVIYAFDVLRPSFLAYAAVVLLLLAGGVQPMLCCIGLFDTWWDFRKAADGLAERRRQWLAGGPDNGNNEE